MDLKAALFHKQQEYKKEKSSSLGSVSSSTVAAAQNAVERAGRKVSEKVSMNGQSPGGGGGGGMKVRWSHQTPIRRLCIDPQCNLDQAMP